MSTATSLRKSPYLEGLFAPQENEVNKVNLQVEGEIPDALCGSLIFNSSNPQFKPRGFYSWFDGDGMVHKLHIANGRAKYVNKYVETQGLRLERSAGRPLHSGLVGKIDDTIEYGNIKDSSNTAVIGHRGSLLSLWHLSGKAYRLNAETLETEGVHDFDGKFEGNMAAHTKLDPRTGDLVFFNYNMLRPPYMNYGVVKADGNVHYTPIDLKVASYCHDIAITENYSILIDMPLEWRAEAKGGPSRRALFFNRKRATRFGVIPRYGTNSDVRWFDALPCYMYHTVNAYEENGVIELFGCRIADPIPERYDAKAPREGIVQFAPVFYHWRFDLKTGETREEKLDDIYTEFPRINDAYLGVAYRYSYHGRFTPDQIRQDALVAYDRKTMTNKIFEMPYGYFCNEPVFVAKETAIENEGYVLSYISHAAQNGQVWVFTASDLAAGPVAKIVLPHRIPPVFHGTWFAA